MGNTAHSSDKAAMTFAANDSVNITQDQRGPQGSFNASGLENFDVQGITAQNIQADNNKAELLQPSMVSSVDNHTTVPASTPDISVTEDNRPANIKVLKTMLRYRVSADELLEKKPEIFHRMGGKGGIALMIAQNFKDKSASYLNDVGLEDFVHQKTSTWNRFTDGNALTFAVAINGLSKLLPSHMVDHPLGNEIVKRLEEERQLNANLYHLVKPHTLLLGQDPKTLASGGNYPDEQIDFAGDIGDVAMIAPLNPVVALGAETAKQVGSTHIDYKQLGVDAILTALTHGASKLMVKSTKANKLSKVTQEFSNKQHTDYGMTNKELEKLSKSDNIATVHYLDDEGIVTFQTKDHEILNYYVPSNTTGKEAIHKALSKGNGVADEELISVLKYANSHYTKKKKKTDIIKNSFHASIKAYRKGTMTINQWNELRVTVPKVYSDVENHKDILLNLEKSYPMHLYSISKDSKDFLTKVRQNHKVFEAMGYRELSKSVNRLLKDNDLRRAMVRETGFNLLEQVINHIASAGGRQNMFSKVLHDFLQASYINKVASFAKDVKDASLRDIDLLPSTVKARPFNHNSLRVVEGTKGTKFSGTTHVSPEQRRELLKEAKRIKEQDIL